MRRTLNLLWLALLAGAWPAARADTAAIDEYLAQAAGPGRIPAIVAVVADRRQVLYQGAFGLRDVAAGAGVRDDSIFRIASMTKPVTSVAIMMLIDEGRLDLDDPVADFLPEFRDKQVLADFEPASGRYTTRAAAGPVTIRQLLAHSAGLGYAFCNEILARIAEPGPGASTAALPLLHDPGARWTYGESTRVLGRVVEAVSGRDLASFLQARIFDPLGMRDTWFTVPAAQRERVVTVHRASGAELIETPNPAGEIASPPQGDGGLHSTAGDYVRFMQMLLNDGRTADGRALLRPATVRLMGEDQLGSVRVSLQPAALPELTRPFPLGAGVDGFGLGFQITAPHAAADRRSPGSLSWAGIFNTQFWIDPRRGIAAVLLMQYLPFYDERAIATLQGFEQRVYQDLLPAAEAGGG